MNRASHRRVFVASRVFTDREDYTTSFRRAVARRQGRDEHRILMWHGVGGQGKTALLAECRRWLEASADACAGRLALGWLDFDTLEERQCQSALLVLRRRLGKSTRIAFPTFDLAYARLFALQQPDKSLRDEHPQLYRRGESELIDDLLGWLGSSSETGSSTRNELLTDTLGLAAPGAHLLYKYGVRLSGRLRDWWDSRVTRHHLDNFDELSPQELLDRLPLYLGYDLWCAQAERDAPRIVLMIDTYEALWRGSQASSAGDTFRTDAWVRTLVAEAPGVLTLICGRDPLRWEELDPSWRNDLEHRPLDALSDEDANTFLSMVPIPARAIRTRIVEAAEGLPFVLDLAVDHYSAVLGSGRPPSRDDFGTTPTEVLERFLDHLSESEHAELRVSSYPPRLSEGTHAALSSRFLGGAGRTDWTRLARRSFFRQEENGDLVMHQLMREALQRRELAERRVVHEQIHDYLLERADAELADINTRSITLHHEHVLLTAAYHARQISVERRLDYLKRRLDVLREAARWSTVIELLEPAASDEELGDEDLGWIRSRFAEALSRTGRTTHAESLYRSLLETISRVSGEGDPRYVTIECDLARVLRSEGRYAEAEALFRHALQTDCWSDRRTDPDYAVLLHDLGQLLRSRGQSKEAETLLRRALAIQGSTLGTDHAHYATTLHSLAYALSLDGKFEEAEQMLRDVLSTTERVLGADHPHFAAALRNLAGTLAARGLYDEAESLYARAKAIFEATCGEGHPHTAVAMHDIARINECLGRIPDAERWYRQTLTVQTRTGTASHPQHALTEHDLGRLLVEERRYDEARPLLRRAMHTLRTRRRPNHPDVVIVCASLGSCLVAQGKHTRGRRCITAARALVSADDTRRDYRLGRVALAYARGLHLAGRDADAAVEAKRALGHFGVDGAAEHRYRTAAKMLYGSAMAVTRKEALP